VSGDVDLWHYAPESRSWTDAVTNRTVLSGLHVDRYVQWLGNRKTTIDPVVPTFLHEVTHHWTFDSAVGATIALLTLQAKRHAFATRCATYKQQYDVFDCLMRATVASTVLRPLAEGLALFAEYDAVPKESPQISTALLAAIYCFGLPLRVDDDRLFPWKATLQLIRRAPEFCARKTSVLQRPFSCEDSYLPGYMAVKGLWTTAVRRSDRLSDTDLYLSFVRRFFFEDPRFVSAILDPGVKEVRAAAQIVDYFIRRSHEFLMLDVEQALDAWLAAFENPPEERTFANLMPGIGATAADFELANERMIPLWTARYDDELLDAFVMTNMNLLRKFMHVGTVRAESEARDGGRTMIRVGDDECVECDPAVSPLPSGPGALSVVWDPATTFLGAFFVSGGKATLVKTFFPGKNARHGKEGAGQVAQYAPLSWDMDQVLTRNLHEALGGHGAILRSELERLRRETLKNAETVYGELATLNLKGSPRDALLDALRKAGLRSVLGHDGAIVNALAAVGIANTITCDRSSVEFLLKAMGVKDQARDRLFTDYQEVQGLRILAVTDSQAMAFV
jgi:hypothetical protein